MEKIMAWATSAASAALLGVSIGIATYTALTLNGRVERLERDVVQIASFLNQQIAQAQRPTPTPQGE